MCNVAVVSGKPVHSGSIQLCQERRTDYFYTIDIVPKQTLSIAKLSFNVRNMFGLDIADVCQMFLYQVFSAICNELVNT